MRPRARRVALPLAVAAVALVSGCGHTNAVIRPLTATPVTILDGEDLAAAGARAVLLPAARSPVMVEVPGCAGRPANRARVAAAVQPRTVVVEPCTGKVAGAGSMIAEGPSEDARGATGMAGRIVVAGDVGGGRVVVPACTPSDVSRGGGTILVRAAARRGVTQAPPCTTSDVESGQTLAMSPGSRAVALATGSGTVVVPPCAATTGGAKVTGAPNAVGVPPGGARARTVVVAPCPVFRAQAPTLEGAGVLVLAPGDRVPTAGAPLAGTVTVPPAGGPRTLIPGCTLFDENAPPNGTGNVTLHGTAAPGCAVSAANPATWGGAAGGSGGGGTIGGGQGGSAG